MYQGVDASSARTKGRWTLFIKGGDKLVTRQQKTAQRKVELFDLNIDSAKRITLIDNIQNAPVNSKSTIRKWQDTALTMRTGAHYSD